MNNQNLKKELFNEVVKRGLIKEQEEETKETSSGFKSIISTLLHSRSQVHIFHWQTNSQTSFAEHMALGGYYDEIGDKMDGLVESYQGKHGLVKDYKCPGMSNYESVKQLISYFEELDSIIEKNRKNIKESYIQNQIDTVQELIFSTLYKLKFLK